MRSGVQVLLVGAAPDTGNLGVTALCHSVLAGVFARLPDAQVTVLDHNRGVREDRFTHAGRSHCFERLGVWASRRAHRRESMLNIRLSAALGGLGSPAYSRLRTASAVLDITGGDSFTDLYGGKRFNAGAQWMRLTLDAGTPLVLLPQTIGPFTHPRRRLRAQAILREASMVWARDEASYAVLERMTGDMFDASRHRCGVDVAFQLPAVRPDDGVLAGAEAFIEQSKGELVGINVSGLIWHSPDTARTRYGFQADYRAVVLALLERLLRRTGASALLIPHVMAPPGHYESDSEACRQAMELLPSEFASRVMVAPALSDPREMKWIISRCAWFCGTRMHSTIAALSSKTPCAAVAYSDKTAGVFATCGQADRVADPRRLSSQEMIDHLWASYEARADSARSLEAHMPGVLDIARRQLDEIVSHISGLGADGAARRTA